MPITLEKLRARLPDMSNTVRVEGTDGKIEIFRDSYGIPHVKTGSVSDAFFGQGFATAQDRLWHMDYDRIRADPGAGVNAIIESADSLPVEYELIGGTPEKWRPWDCLAVFKVRHILCTYYSKSNPK